MGSGPENLEVQPNKWTETFNARTLKKISRELVQRTEYYNDVYYKGAHSGINHFQREM